MNRFSALVGPGRCRRGLPVLARGGRHGSFYAAADATTWGRYVNADHPSTKVFTYPVKRCILGVDVGGDVRKREASAHL